MKFRLESKEVYENESKSEKRDRCIWYAAGIAMLFYFNN